jgi:AcrR family transcriptional regulator
MNPDSRTRMVRSAAALISTCGLTATSFSEVLAHSGAPRGSIYHHFPDGKKQLAAEAVRWTSDQILTHLRATPATTAAEVLDWFVALFRDAVLRSGGAAGCAVAGVALDTGAEDADLIPVVREAFEAWMALLVEQLEAVGVPVHRAEPIALAALASLEGALILCRATGDTRPLDIVAAELTRLLPPENAGASSRSRPKPRTGSTKSPTAADG